MSDAKPKRKLLFTAHPAYPPEIGVWLLALEDARQRTKQALAGIAPAAIDFAAPCIDNTIGALLYHIAAIEADWLYADVLEQPFPEAMAAQFPHDVRDAAGRLTAVVGVSLDDHLARLDAVRATLMEAFHTVSVADFRRVRHFDAYDVTPEWVLHHLCQHEAEHRGQISEARRLAEAR
ncbi:MAG: DinB family protein [Caldilineaceae bacterium]|nr:DinB family protein [Caldilineaceae bacterium]